jgi:hypothetical protein
MVESFFKRHELRFWRDVIARTYVISASVRTRPSVRVRAPNLSSFLAEICAPGRLMFNVRCSMFDLSVDG